MVLQLTVPHSAGEANIDSIWLQYRGHFSTALTVLCYSCWKTVSVTECITTVLHLSKKVRFYSKSGLWSKIMINWPGYKVCHILQPDPFRKIFVIWPARQYFWYFYKISIFWKWFMIQYKHFYVFRQVLFAISCWHTTHQLIWMTGKFFYDE